MTFLRSVKQLKAKLVHHTGTMIRFTTSQLPYLPLADSDCQVTLLDGKTVDGRFHLHPANPYIGGRELVRWIKTWVQWNRPVSVLVEQIERGSHIRLRTLRKRRVITKAQRLMRREASRMADIKNIDRRRREYTAWERNPALRKVVLQAWPPKCQVRGCKFPKNLPRRLRATIIEVHHIISISARGSDSPFNVCFLCANHHALIDRAPHSAVQSCGPESVTIVVDGITLKIKRDVTRIWRLIDV